MTQIIENNTTSKHAGIIMVAYILFAVGLLTVHSTSIIGVILVYLKRDDVRGTYLDSHCQWLIGVFWWSVLWSCIAWATIWIGIGFVIFGVLWIWVAYKLLKGFLKLHVESAV